MNSKIILATSGTADVESLFNCIGELIENTAPMLIEANVCTGGQVSNAFPDARSMQEARDMAYSNVHSFEKTCVKLHIKHAARPQFDNYFFEDLVEDSRFADLIVCSIDLISNDVYSHKLKANAQPMLRRLQCPVLIVPKNARQLMPVDLFAFDGTLNSIRAIKTFTYLFPQRCDREVLIYSSYGPDGEKEEMTTWFSAHFPRLKWVSDIRENNGYNLICGSFGRSALSTFIHSSFAEEVIASNSTPVFICHS